MNIAELTQNLKDGQFTAVKRELLRFGKVVEEIRENADFNSFLAGRHNSCSVDYLDANFVIETHNGNIIRIVHSGVDSYLNHHYTKPL